MRWAGIARGATLLATLAHARPEQGGKTPNNNAWSAGQSHEPIHCISLRTSILRRVLRRHPLRHRLPLGPRRAEEHRHRNGRVDGGSVYHQSPPDVRLCRSTQRDGAAGIQAMVDAIRAEVGRAQYLRAVLEPRAHPAVLAMAPDTRCGLAHRQSADRYGDDRAVVRRVADRAE